MQKYLFVIIFFLLLLLLSTCVANRGARMAVRLHRAILNNEQQGKIEKRINKLNKYYYGNRKCSFNSGKH